MSHHAASRRGSLLATEGLVTSGEGASAVCRACRTGAAARPFARPSTRAKYARDRRFDVRHIRLEIEPDFDARSIAGTCRTTLAPLNDGLRHVELDAVEMTIESVTLESPSGGVPLAFDHDGAVLRIDLASARRAGEALTVAVAYRATPRRGLYFIAPDEAYPKKRVHVWSQGQDEDSRHWFPCFDYPNQKASSELVATVPEGFYALSNGRLAGKRTVEAGENEKRRKTVFHWRQDVPHVAYLVTLVAGEYVEIDGGSARPGVPVTFHVPPGREADALRSFSNTLEMLRLFEEKTGEPYPYEKYAQITVADFIFGGMENTSATTLTENTLHDARAHLDFSSDSLVAHELAHQWFGDLLTCRDWSQAWLNEGFATYFEAVWKEAKEGRDEMLLDLHRKALDYFEEDSGSYRRPIVTTAYEAPIELFDRHLYEKAALVLHTLRSQLGDELFWKGVRHYVARHKGRSVVTDDLARAFEEATGRNLDRFFEQWVRGAGYPQFKVSFDWDSETRIGRLRVQQTQAPSDGASGESVFEVEVPVEVVTASGRVTHRIAITERDQAFHFASEERPLFVAFDKGNGVLKSLEFERGTETLAAALERDEDPVGRIRAAESLGKIGSAEAVAALRRAVLEDRCHGVQAAAAAALGKARGDAAREALFAALGIENPKARRAVVRALGEFRADEAVAARLASILERGDASYFVEAEAARSLGKTKSKAAFDPIVRALAKESHVDVIRQLAFAGLAELEDERGIAIAKEWAARGKPDAARAGAVLAIGKLGEGKSDARDFLVALLDDPSFRVKLAAVSALSEIRDEKAIPALARLRDRDLDGRVKRRASDAIERIRSEKDRSEEVRKLRQDVDKLADENRALRERLDKMEARLAAERPPAS